MKKYCFFIMLLFACSISFGQSLDDISKLINKGDYKKAKEGLDKFLSDSKNASNAVAYYYKGRILNGLSKDSTLAAAESIKLKSEAFELFKKLPGHGFKRSSFYIGKSRLLL